MTTIVRWLVGCTAAFVLAAGPVNVARADTSHDKLMHMIQSAKTRADHEEIAAIYEHQAQADRDAAGNHQRMESLYKGFDSTAGGRGGGQMAVHCKNLAAEYSRAAQDNDALAKWHRQAAADAK